MDDSAKKQSEFVYDIPLVAGPFDGSVKSLKNYKTPDWFRDAKFGIWAHWGPQAVPHAGDWYARNMYLQGSRQYKHHIENYGHPSTFGYKDIIPLWKAEKFDPEGLMKLYAKAGARYFVSMGVHHDNFDLWDSRHHAWNSVKMGPKRDIVGEFKLAAQKYGLRFGVSEHLGASYSWFAPSRGFDQEWTPNAHIAYDGSDPAYEDLYHEAHDEHFAWRKDTWYAKNPVWHQKWFNRITDLVERYQPDLLYTDGGIPFGEVGRTLVANFYNSNVAANNGVLQAVHNHKALGSGEFIREAGVETVERGVMEDISPLPWQTDTSMGDWYYSEGHEYKTTTQIVHMLADIVSKNGNLLLNVVQYADGSLPPEALTFLEEMAAWMEVNSEAIYSTRPWVIYGEGPSKIVSGAFNEKFVYTAQDIRFTQKKGVLYAITLGIPKKTVRIESLGLNAKYSDKRIKSVHMLGHTRELKWTQTNDSLVVDIPEKMPGKHAVTIKVEFIENAEPPTAFGPIPNENQMAWQEMEYYAFVHFSLNTYTDQPWGYGNEDVSLFNPTELDVREWVRTMKQAGMKGVILTVKHHSGFALWPSKYTEYSVKNSPWKNGNGDLVREVADACKEYGLKFGVYLSPWDRNRADYGTPDYITYFRNQLTELLTNYGPIFEVWFDGAHGGGGYYGGANENRIIDRSTYYDWQNTYKLVRELQPNIVIWNDGGDRADLRWVGTEGGWVGETNWSLLNAQGDVPWHMLHHGVETGDSWVPAEVNTSIRPEWFYHPNEDDRVKTVPQLMDTYYNSIGRNATLLLNFPIMPNGQIHKTDKKAVLDMAKVVEESFAVNLAEKAKVGATNIRANNSLFGAENTVDGNKDTYWATDDNLTTASLTIEFNKPTVFNRFLAQEYIRLGQRVKAFTLEAYSDNQWKEIAKGTTIGYKRILRFPSVSATKVRFTVTDSKSSLVISNIGVYDAPALLNAPQILRSQQGEVSISANDIGPYFYYTLDGSTPTPKSNRYVNPVPTDGKIEVRAIAYDVSSNKSSPVAVEQFDISRKNWKVLGEPDTQANYILDGNPSTHWYQPQDNEIPVDLVIDMGEEKTLTGFKYFPHPDTNWNPGIITHYEFYVSLDNLEWTLVEKGEFSNIKNNPVLQIRTFNAEKARYFKLRALQNIVGNNRVGYAEVDVITR